MARRETRVTALNPTESHSSFNLAARSAGPTAGSIIIEGRSQRSNIYPASVRVARLSKAAPAGLDSGLPVPILWGMVRKRATFRELDVSLFARNRALDYLANSHKHRLNDDLRYQLTQVVEGYEGRCDEAAARAGIEWMRERYRDDGKTPRF